MILATESGRQEVTWLVSEHAQAGLAQHLAFEITEDVYIARSGDIIAASVEHFRSLGIEIHLDDFGTGHASYQHLRCLTPDQVKIDGSLVAEMGTDSPADIVIEGFIYIARGMGAAVVAENVETEAQRRSLQAMACDYIEGHVFAPAMPAREVEELLRNAAPESTPIKQSSRHPR